MDNGYPDGDLSFVGVDMRHSPSIVSNGFLSNAENVRFNRGVAETRGGIQKLNITNTNVDFIGYPSFTDIYGAGVFRDPGSGAESVLIGANNQVLTADTTLKTADEGRITADGGVGYGKNVVFSWHVGSAAYALPFPTGEAVTDDCTFVQAFDVIILLRGEGKDPLVMTSLNEGFKTITQTDISERDTSNNPNNSGDGTLTIPPSINAIFFGNRLLVQKGTDSVVASDLLDYTRYSLLNDFRINQGENDQLIALKKFTETSVICFKERSVYIVYNLFGDYSAARLDRLTTEYGCIARKTVVSVGTDVWFLSHLGVMSITQTSENNLQAVTTPMSDPILPLVLRINWAYADKATAAYWESKFYMAVPLDGSTVNNVIFVYDFENKAWAGFDTGDAIKVKNFFVLKTAGRDRLYFASTDGYINLCEEGSVDEVLDSGAVEKSNSEIQFSITTRGYDFDSIDDKKVISGNMAIETWNPSFSVDCLQDGAFEQFSVLGTQTRDTRKYMVRGKADDVFPISHSDWDDKWREDYSVSVGNFTVNDPDAVVAPPAYSPKLDFSEKRNSQYAWL